MGVGMIYVYRKTCDFTFVILLIFLSISSFALSLLLCLFSVAPMIHMGVAAKIYVGVAMIYVVHTHIAW